MRYHSAWTQADANKQQSAVPTYSVRNRAGNNRWHQTQGVASAPVAPTPFQATPFVSTVPVSSKVISGNEYNNLQRVQHFSDPSSGIKALMDPNTPNYVTKIFQNEYTTGMNALNAKKAPTFTRENLMGYARANENSLLGNAGISREYNSYLDKQTNEFSKETLDYANAQNTAKDAIKTLDTPDTLKNETLALTSGAVQHSLEWIGQQYGYDYTVPYKALSTALSSNEKYNASMAKLFSNYLGISYDLPSEINTQVDNINTEIKGKAATERVQEAQYNKALQAYRLKEDKYRSEHRRIR